MEQSAEGPVQGRRTAGRHAARRSGARAERPAADLETERGLEDGGRVGRRRHGRRRARTRNARLVAGAAVLAGGVAVLIGTNGTFGGVLTASGAPARSADVVRQAGAGDSGNVPANPGRAPTGAKGASEAREVRKGEARDDAPATDRPSAQPSSGKAGRPATPQTTAEPGTIPGDTVSGSTATGDAEVSLPERDGGADYKADRFSKHTDPQAAEYFRTHWGPDDKAMKRLKDIRTVGGYLRIYTDLPDTADNSRTAITLCKRGLQYLRESGVRRPIVFVQAEFGENGNPVLANILGPSDKNCRVTYPEPN